MLDSMLPCTLLQLFVFEADTLHFFFKGEVAALQQDAEESASKCA